MRPQPFAPPSGGDPGVDIGRRSLSGEVEEITFATKITRPMAETVEGNSLQYYNTTRLRNLRGESRLVRILLNLARLIANFP